jgi:outer membrane protein TolC
MGTRTGNSMGRTWRAAPFVASAVAVVVVSGCSPQKYREQADRKALQIIDEKQAATLGKTEPFTIERPAETLRRRLMIEQNLPHSAPGSRSSHDLEPIEHWPADDYLSSTTRPADPLAARAGPGLIRLSLFDALQVAAYNNREYQARKEGIFQDALQLDLARDEFRPFFTAGTGGRITRDLGGPENVTGAVLTNRVGVEQRLAGGARISVAILHDLAALLTGNRATSRGLATDISIAVPLLRGAGEHVVTEPLTQAERNVAYSLLDFEQYKRTFAVNIASQYLAVLQRLDTVVNAEESYRRLVVQVERSRVLTEAGWLPPFQMDQALTDELAARDSWIAARAAYTDSLDGFKVLLGLPPDARIELERRELDELARSTADMLQIPLPGDPATPPPADPAADPQAPATQPADPVAVERVLRQMPAPEEVVLQLPDPAEAGRFELPETRALELALENRPDLRVARGVVYDAQRRITVAANALKAGLSLSGSASAGSRRGVGSAGLPDAQLRFDQGSYTAGFDLDLPLERTAERNAYRNSYIAMEQAVRSLQATEDQIKLAVRNRLSDLLQAREALKTQTQAVIVAERRVASTEMLFEAGRVQVREVLEATAALTRARNALTSALVRYRVAELAMGRDLGVLEVDEEGLWREYIPR